MKALIIAIKRVSLNEQVKSCILNLFRKGVLWKSMSFYLELYLDSCIVISKACILNCFIKVWVNIMEAFNYYVCT